MESYGTIAKWFHWLTVGLVAVALPVGFVIQHITEKDDSATKLVFYAIHESAGVTLFVVVLLRLLWRLRHPAPPLPASVPRPMRLAAAAVHHALYTLLLVQPVLGFVATNAWGFPLRGATAYLGVIDFPVVMAKNEALAEVVQNIHTVIGWAILVLLALHIGAVVFHQAIRRDGLLLRMV